MRLLILITLFSQVAFAQFRSNLFKKDETSIEKETTEKHKTIVKKPKNQASGGMTVGNLPSYLVIRGFHSSESSPVILPTQKQNIKSSDLFPGEVIQAEILESLIAFADSKAPVRAVIKSGKLKNSILIGEATLEKNSKRILIDFKKLRVVYGNQIYDVVAYALDQKGILGIEGQLVSNEDKYFAAEFLSAAAAGVTDASIERNQNAYGNYIEKPSTDTLGKKALVSALSTTTNHFAEKLKKIPEYSIVEGTFEIQILITEQPTLIN